MKKLLAGGSGKENNHTFRIKIHTKLDKEFEKIKVK